MSQTDSGLKDLRTNSEIRVGKNVLHINREGLWFSKTRSHRVLQVFAYVFQLVVCVFSSGLVWDLNREHYPQFSQKQVIFLALMVIGLVVYLVFEGRSMLHEIRTWHLSCRNGNIFVNGHLFGSQVITTLWVRKRGRWDGRGEPYEICLRNGKKDLSLSRWNPEPIARKITGFMAKELGIRIGPEPGKMD